MCDARDLGPSLGQEDPQAEGMAPLQYLRLGNPVNSEAWRAALYGVTKSDITKWLTLSLLFGLRISTEIG